MIPIWNLKIAANSLLFQKPAVHQPFLEVFDPFAGVLIVAGE